MFSVGEFSTLAQVSRRLLRYYDEIGLLTPAYTDPSTSYRFYSAEQMVHLNRILVLKELGMSLDQIRRMLGDQVSTAEMRGMLLLKKAEIEQTLRAELQRVRKVEARLEAILSSESAAPLDVVIKPVPAQTGVSVTTMLESFDAALALHAAIIHALPERSGYGLSFTICHDEDILERDMTLEIGRLTEVRGHAPVMLHNGLELQMRHLPAVEMMATTIVTGSLEDIHIGYGRIGLWAQANQYRMVGAPREFTLNVPRSADGRDLVTEIQLPVQALADR